MRLEHIADKICKRVWALFLSSLIALYSLLQACMYNGYPIIKICNLNIVSIHHVKIFDIRSVCHKAKDSSIWNMFPKKRILCSCSSLLPTPAVLDTIAMLTTRFWIRSWYTFGTRPEEDIREKYSHSLYSGDLKTTLRRYAVNNFRLETSIYTSVHSLAFQTAPCRVTKRSYSPYNSRCFVQTSRYYSS